MVRIGYVSPGWPPSKCENGIVSYIGNIYSQIEHEDIKPVILSFSIKNKITPNLDIINLSEFENNGVLKRIKKIIPLSLYINRTASRKIIDGVNSLSEKLDLIEVEDTRGLAIRLKKKLAPTKIITRVHGPWFLLGPILNQKITKDDKYRIKLERKAIIASDGLTAPSQDVIDQIREHYDCSIPLARVIPNTILPVSDDDLWADRDSVIPSILYVGRFDRLKGADLILSAFRQIALKNKEVILKFAGRDRGLFVGGCSYSFAEYIDKFIPERSIRNRIEYLGVCSPCTIIKLRKMSAVTVVCSRYETFSLSLLEAMAMGCPVVATKVGGMKEIVVDQENGLFAEPDSAESIAISVEKLLDDRILCKKLSKAAISICKTKYHPQEVVPEMGAYYRKIANLS